MNGIVFIKNFPNRGFADQAKEILNRNNITCVLKSPDLGIMGSSTTSTLYGVDLYVEEKDAKQALALMNALFNGI